MYIRDWQKKLGAIYSNNEMTPDYIMVHLSTKCSELSRIFNHQKQHYLSTDPYILKSLSWLIALCNYFELDLEKELICRFPGKCGYCLRSPCHCSDTNKKTIDQRTGREWSIDEIELELGFLRNNFFNSGVRLTFNDFRKLIFGIYPANKLFVYSGYYAFPLGKLDEERGELHKAYSSYLLKNGKKEEIAIEVADVAAWLLSFWGVHQQEKNIDTELSNLFANGCPACNSYICTCPRYSITKSEEELIRDIIRSLRTIKISGIGDKNIIDQIVSIAQDMRNEANPTVRQEFFSTVEQLTNDTKKAPAVSEIILNEAGNVDKALSNLKKLYK